MSEIITEGNRVYFFNPANIIDCIKQCVLNRIIASVKFKHPRNFSIFCYHIEQSKTTECHTNANYTNMDIEIV